MRRTARAGFTLLEVLLATSIMAIGATSILVVFATAAGMANQRQMALRREQVIEEARHEAQAIVDAFRPGAQATAASAPAAGARRTASASKLAPDKVEAKRSTRFAGYAYDLAFEPMDRSVPEKGYDVTITVRYGGGEFSHTTTTSMLATTIHDDEFGTSSTYEEEQKGLGSRDKPREKR